MNSKSPPPKKLRRSVSSSLSRAADNAPPGGVSMTDAQAALIVADAARKADVLMLSDKLDALAELKRETGQALADAIGAYHQDTASQIDSLKTMQTEQFGAFLKDRRLADKTSRRRELGIIVGLSVLAASNLGIGIYIFTMKGVRDVQINHLTDVVQSHEKRLTRVEHIIGGLDDLPAEK